MFFSETTSFRTERLCLIIMSLFSALFPWLLFLSVKVLPLTAAFKICLRGPFVRSDFPCIYLLFWNVSTFRLNVYLKFDYFMLSLSPIGIVFTFQVRIYVI